MVINENNAQINAFVKGMNTDTAYDQVDNQQYVYGKNIRITKNDFVGGTSGNFPSVHEGVITPVPEGDTHEFLQDKTVIGTFLGSDTINDIAVVITKNDNKLIVWRAKINNDPGQNEEYTEGFTKWWECALKNDEYGKIVQVSTVTYQELEGVIKLYIATGIYPIIEIRIDDTTGAYTGPQNIDDFLNNRILPKYPVWIDAIVDGSLKTSQVQYTYRYYDKFGITTQLAPLTNKIQVIDSNRAKETGNAQDTKTSIGFKLVIKGRDEYAKFKRLQIFRLQYITPGEDAKVELIYDGEVPNAQTFTFNDVGTVPLQELSMEEFAAMSGMVVIPTVIEQNQQYMFAANVKDDTIIPNLTISPDNYVSLYNNLKVKLSTNITGIPQQSSSVDADQNKQKYLKDRNVNPKIVANSYNNIFTSSLLRSLRRGEDYQYGIVYYDKYGRRSNVQQIGKLTVPEISSSNKLVDVSSTLDANICGAEIILPQPQVNNVIAEGIVGCQIVRRSSKKIYQKTLLQVALARPVYQKTYITHIDNVEAIKDQDEAPKPTPKKSPYYPTGFLMSDTTRIWPGYQKYPGDASPDWLFYLDYRHPGSGQWNPKGTDYFTATSKENNELFQIFSSEIDFRRDDQLSALNSSTTTINPVFYLGISDSNNASENNYIKYNRKVSDYMYQGSEIIFTSPYNIERTMPYDDLPLFMTKSSVNNIQSIDILRMRIKQDSTTKISEKLIFPMYIWKDGGLTVQDGHDNIKSIKDVKLPQWYDGFSNLQIDGTAIAGGGIKKYEEFQTNIDNYQYDNWVSFGLYDMRISFNDSQPNTGEAGEHSRSALFLAPESPKNRNVGLSNGQIAYCESRGWIGPGPSCFLVTVDKEVGQALHSTNNNGDVAICNIQHEISSGQSEPDEFIQYFGFGNFFKLNPKYEVDQSGNNMLVGYTVAHNYECAPNSSEETKMVVFDGDVYITPQEITTMYKTYDFMSNDTLQSMQITNYVPMESKVNTFFDYGMNLLNTNSSNLLVEPGSIDGVTTQDRPAHQYNQIYSANDESNDVFTLVVEKSEDNQFKQRTYYSEPKTNGEYVDNFVIFKPAAYIDVDPKYGEITNLLTDKNILYYWQDTAFGKFSVNERSLINDTNGNTIMLGQAGILSRNDYISTKYGMRPYDYCATGAESGVYWVDINNRAVVAGNSNECINFGERLNVQNIINQRIYDGTDKRPKVDYDLQNNELLCQCFDGQQIVFNLKANIATSIYTRDYIDILNIKNHIYGYKPNSITRYNYLKDSTDFLSPMAVSLIVNATSSTTKVFDSQQLVPANRKPWDSQNDEDQTTYFEDAVGSVSFETDINSTTNTIQPYTDREGNIIYNIPRFGENDWGNRLRGKWMRVDFNFVEPTQYTTISHIITKFRQSYS